MVLSSYVSLIGDSEAMLWFDDSALMFSHIIHITTFSLVISLVGKMCRFGHREMNWWKKKPEHQGVKAFEIYGHGNGQTRT